MSPGDAHAALDAAIHDVAVAREDIRAGEVLTGWAVVATYQRADGDETSYLLIFPGGGTAPPHAQAGLFGYAQHLVLFGEHEGGG